MNKDQVLLEKLGEKIALEKRIISEIGPALGHLQNSRSPEERQMISSQINNLISSLKKTGDEIIDSAERISLAKPLEKKDEPEKSEAPFKKEEASPVPKSKQPLNQINPNEVPTINQAQPETTRTVKGPLELREDEESGGTTSEKEGKDGLTTIERLTIKRIKKGEKKEKVKGVKKPSGFAKVSSKYFYNQSMAFLKRGFFDKLKRDLVKGNIEFVPAAYLSIVLFSTVIATIIATLVVAFFTFFSFSFMPPFISMAGGSILGRFLQLVLLIPLACLGTLVFGYMYPSLEKKSLERKIDHELPFAAIHMSAVSSAMIEPSKMFNIIISTGEYPNLKKEFTKLQNEINVYGYDLVTALKNRAYNSPSKKLAELFNGLATTINSGGNLPVFFEKRAQTLLFEYRIEVEKQGRSAETFMDVYISVVIAAPMVLMLLLMMMRISGLGIALSTGMITLTVVSVVSFINIIFLGFLQLKGKKT